MTDLNLDEKTVWIHQTVLRVRGEGLVVKPTTKTPAGERTLELPKWCVEMLKRRDRKGTYVFESQLGHLRDPHNTRRDLRNAMQRIGYEGVTSHLFRRSVASALDDAGLPARKAADQLGHSRTTVTQDRYFGRNQRVTGTAEALESLRV